MQILIEEISSSKNWRINEISRLKRILAKESMKNIKNYELLSKYSIPIICGIWEGFFKETIKNYYLFLNRNENIKGDIYLLTNLIEHNNLFNSNIQHFESKINFTKNIKNILENPLFEESSPKIGLKKLKETNKFLENLHLDKLNNDYKKDLNALISHRNLIIHGETTKKHFSINEILNYCELVINLMNELEDIILKKVSE